MKFTIEPIGYILTEHKKKVGTPIQPSFAKDHRGIAVLYDKYIDGLKDLEDFSYIILIYYFDRHDDHQLLVKPYLDEAYHGIFATRAPKRPNQIGLSVVNLLEIKDNKIEFLGADMLDNTPLLDIKPYVPDFDHPGDVKTGWYEKNKTKKKPLADDRF